jgi:hypothetical protein
MSALTMMETVAVVLALATISGPNMAVLRLRGADRPFSSLALAHGVLAAAALMLLIYVSFAL